MGFRTGGYAKIWEINKKENYSEVSLTTRRKSKETGKYETDFRSKFVRFVGDAHKKLQDVKTSDTIKILGCDVQSRYNKDKNTNYVNYIVFDFEKANNESLPEEATDDLPF